jgi:pyruvate formate lyase activating enzyme
LQPGEARSPKKEISRSGCNMTVSLRNTAGVKGLLPVSMLDWEGHLVTTLFMGGCNLRCPFCHNASLALDNGDMPEISEDEINRVLSSKKGWVDAICITGGEPTVNPALFELIAAVRELGYKVKLDTNGTLPDVLRRLLDERLIDAVAMDIKTGFSKYPLATGVARDFSTEVKKSARLLVDAHRKGISEVEFRTTVVPGFVELQDVVEIAKFIGGLGDVRYYLQQFNPKAVMLSEVGSVKPYTVDQLEEMVSYSSQHATTFLRGK